MIIILLISLFLLVGCASSPQTALPDDLAVISTSAVATVYANLTISPARAVSTPTATPALLPAAIIDKFNVPMKLVSAGPFLMGRDESAGDQPYVQVTVGDYYMDTYEVTNQRYMACVHAGVCAAPLNPGSYTHANYYLNPAFGDYPVISVNWQTAETYCAWRGAHLPTEIEWEKAARGVDGRRYPWGDALPDGTRANLCDKNCYQNWADKSIDDGYTDVAPVGSFPAGVSPYGLMDMAGNMDEWVAQVGFARQAYLGVSLTESPTPEGSLYEPRGGSWTTSLRSWKYMSGDNTPPALLTENSNQYFSQNVAQLNMGFRCASSPTGQALDPVFKPLRSTATPAPTHTYAPTRTPTLTATILPAARSTNVYPIALVRKADSGAMSLHLINDDGSGLRTIFPLGQDLSFAIREPTWSPDGSSLYFIGYHSDPAQGVNQQFLYQAEPSETDPQRVYHSIAGLPDLTYEKLALSPDGRYLALVYTPGEDDKAYLSGGNVGIQTLGLFDLKTRVWRTLTLPYLPGYSSDICLSPDAWSPQSRQFTFTALVNAYARLEPGGPALISSRQGGGEQVSLFVANLNAGVKNIGAVSSSDVPTQCPVWSTAGKQIIFAGYEASADSDSEILSLLSVHPDGSGRIQVGYELPEVDGPSFWVSPDGLRLAAVFSMGGSKYLADLAPNGDGLLEYPNGYDGRGEGDPWSLLSGLAGQNFEFTSLNWSPNSSQMVFSSCGPASDLCIVNADGTDLFDLTADLPTSYEPAWSPDGLKIAFMTGIAGTRGLYVMNSDGSGLLRLTDLESAGDRIPGVFFWSPRAVELSRP